MPYPTGVKSIAAAICPRAPSGKVFAMIVAYGDESGIHAGSKFYVMAAYIASAEQWAAFDEKWCNLLKQYEITQSHAKELFQSQGEFKGWPTLKKQRYIHDIRNLLTQEIPVGCSAQFAHQDYDKVFVEEAARIRTRRTFSKYGAAFAGLMEGVAQSVGDVVNRDEPVNFVLASGARGNGDATHFHSELLRFSTARIGSLTFAKAADLPGLQAADMFAHCAWRFMSLRGTVKRLPQEWDLYLNATKPVHRYAILDRKVLRNVRTGGNNLRKLALDFDRAFSAQSKFSQTT